MADTSQTNQQDLYSIHNQITIKNVYLFRLDSDGNAPSQDSFVDIKSIVEEINIYEGVLDSTLSAQIFITDPLNLPDNFPLVRGEIIRLIYTVPSTNLDMTLDFVNYKVGERIHEHNGAKAQQYWVYLCTADRYNDANTDLSMAFQGPYDEVIKACVGALQSSNVLDFDKSQGIQNFIAPMWSPLKTAMWCAARAVDEKLSPFLFWESTDGYHFKSLRGLYNQDPTKQIYIEPLDSSSHTNDPDKSFNTALAWRYLESNDALRQAAEGVFGADAYFFDINNKTIETNSYDYSQMFVDAGCHVDDFQLYDDMKGFRSKTKFYMNKDDGSQLGRFQRNAAMSTMKNYHIIVEIPGDPTLTAGQVVEMDVPSLTGGVEYSPERTASGRWFCMSIRHILKRDKYTMMVELGKDSYMFDVTKQITGVSTDGVAQQ